MSVIELSEKVKKEFNIQEVKHEISGGQKSVFIVAIGGIDYALKYINIANERFKREVAICEKFAQIEGIPKIIEIRNFEEKTFIIEEYIDGKDLLEHATSYKGNAKKIILLLKNLIEILTPIWDGNYVHRDLKPQNIRIRNNGKAVVLDFGIARALNDETLTASGFQPFSPLFASPEQYAGKKRLISYRTDFFSLGIIAYYLYTGNLPFGGTQTEIAEKYDKGSLSIQTGEKAIDKFCNAVLKINPSERPRTIELLSKTLEL